MNWHKVPLKLLDIRRISLPQGTTPLPYALPANAFLFAVQGSAVLLLDGVKPAAAGGRNRLLHAGKGASLEIRGIAESPFGYYLVLYKPLDKPRVSSKQPGAAAPFEERYAFAPRQPWQLLELLERMHLAWTEGGEPEKLLAHGLFYQFVYEQDRQYRQYPPNDPESIAPDLAEELARYIRLHYREPITMETLSQSFHYSTHYLARVFKRKYGCSPLGFLVRTRMTQARQLLAEEGVAVRDIAEIVGYSDMYYFNKLFKKQTGVTPVQYKMHVLGLLGSNRPKSKSNLFIAPRTSADYSVNNDSDNHYQHNSWGVDELNGNRRTTWAASLLFSLSLLLAACGGAGNNNEAAANEEGGSPAATAQEAAEGTRAYTDALGKQVEIPAQPKRAVIITYGGYLLPLGLKPVGADQGTLDQYPEDMADVANIGRGLGTEEAILALKPDLIIVPDYFDPTTYAGYQKIAPTIAVAWGGDPDVVNTLRTMGDIMNRKAEAEAWIAKFEEKLQRIRDQIDVKIAAGTTATTFIFYEGEFLIGGEGGTLGKLIYKDYGFEMPEDLKQFKDGGTALSVEAFVAQPAEYFFTQMTDEEMVALQEKFKEPLYQAIPAVKNNRIINVSRDKWNYGPYLVDEAVDEFIEKMKQLQ